MTTTIKDQAALVRGSEDHSTSTNGVHPPAKLTCPRRFTKPNQHPFDDVEWVIRDALIGPADKPVFEQKGVEFPAFWSQNAVNVVADKYFRGKKADKEKSVRTMITRVATWYYQVVQQEGYFASQADHDALREELMHALVHQRFAFNTPVLLNVGRTGDKPPRCSACFTLSVEDSMEAILNWYVEEGMVFKAGSGAGINLSSLREKGAPLRDGGGSSGPVSFMQGADASAGTIKSGGACLAPHTLVYTHSGPVPVRELAENGKPFVCLSYDPPAGRFKAKWAVAWHAGRKQVVRVTTDKGVFELSYDHPMRTRTGQSVKAGVVLPGMALQPCNVDDQRGYVRIGLWNGRKGKAAFQHLVAVDLMDAHLGQVAHHRAEDKTKNHPDDLELLSVSEHSAHHNRLRVEAGIHHFQTHTYPKTGSFNPMHSSAAFWQDTEKAGAYRAAKAEEMRPRARAIQPLAATQRMLNLAYRLINLGCDIGTFELYVDARQKHIAKVPNIAKLRGQVDARFGSYAGFLKALVDGNHRVVSVETIGEMDVYDVEVQCPTPDDKSPTSGHNFVIWSQDNTSRFGSGVVVFNCRRAAKLVVLNVDHPDIEEFIDCKVHEEKKARALAAAGFDMSVGGKDIFSVQYQNANNSVGLYDEFLQACESYDDWSLKSVLDGCIVKTLKARSLLRKIAAAAHACADPGIFYLGTMNKWHTSPNTGYLDVANPCCEFLRRDSACNLASLRLTKYYRDGRFQFNDFAYDVSLLITVMDASVSHAEYPVAKIAENVRLYRELGIGFCDLGALLMQMGLPYDSDAGRAMAAAVTALMSGLAWCRSGELAEVVGPYPGWSIPGNAQAHRNVMLMHRAALDAVDPTIDAVVPVLNAAKQVWDKALSFREKLGYRNAQVSLVAPTGTISFMMDADTTGVEPELALVKFKKLSGGGTMKIINQSVPAALKKLGYTEQEVTNIVAHVLETGAVAGSPIRREDLPVFDCSLGERSISPMGHLKMTAAIQPFIDGSSSKTVNLPNSATVEDFEQMILEGWKLGVKNLAMYRDGCKVDQPLNVIAKPVEATAASPVPAPSVRRRLPRTRQGATTSFSVAGCEGYLKRGEYPDGQLGEIFLQLTKSGSTLDGFLDSCAIAFSLALQHNVPLETLVSKYVNTRFEPSGPTDDPDFPFATSVMDYVARRLAGDYLPVEVCHRLGILTTKERAADLDAKEGRSTVQRARTVKTDAPFCDRCGVRMQAAGACYACSSCGATSGCS